MDAIILAGGLGTRLRTVVSDVPKPLASVNGRPFLDILLRQVSGCKWVHKIILAVSYKAEAVITEYSHPGRFSTKIAFSIEQEPLGTGGAIKQALIQASSPEILVMNGDSFVDIDLTSFYDEHYTKAADATLAVVQVPDAARFGAVEIDSDSGRVRRFEEKGAVQGEAWISAGCYLLRREIFDDVDVGARKSIELDLFPRWVDSKRIYFHRCAGRFLDIGTPESYASAPTVLAGLS